jgi:ATP synthase protein I
MSDEPPDALKRLGERIDKARSERVARQPATVDRSTMQRGLGPGLRIGIELVVAIAVATGLGWAIDRWLGTKPWGMIVLFFLGVGVGMLNVYRAVTGITAPVGYRRPGEDGASAGAEQDEWDDDEN